MLSWFWPHILTSPFYSRHWKFFQQLVPVSLSDFCLIKHNFDFNFICATEVKEVKKALSKKERKALEDAEFAALMGEVPTASPAQPEEAKAKTEEAANNEASAKNKKKKEKRKAKAATAPAEEKKEEVKELTKEEKEAAVKAALAKRGNVQKVETNNEKAKQAAAVKAEKEKRGGNKKKFGATPIHWA